MNRSSSNGRPAFGLSSASRSLRNWLAIFRSSAVVIFRLNGDPGTTHDGSTPRDQLPPYLGPEEPAAPHSHEWGAALADEPEDMPLEGPALAPYGQAEDE